eukprot:COSAG02_NODE_657_length_18797_cov_34.071238_15_plen_145_part_00
MKFSNAMKKCSTEPRGRLKSLRTIAPDPRRWPGCRGPAADARRAGGAGCGDSSLKWRAGGPRRAPWPAALQSATITSCVDPRLGPCSRAFHSYSWVVANANRRIIRVIRALFANIRPIRAPNECPPIRMMKLRTGGSRHLSSIA